LKLLFFAAYFPPAPLVSAVRAWNFVKQLARRGWDVTVVTPDPRILTRADSALEIEGVKRILVRPRFSYFWYANFPDQGWWRVLYFLARRLARAFGCDSQTSWAARAEEACALLRAGDFDIVLATGSPFETFPVAARVAGRLGCPFVLDYRDPWTDNALVWWVKASKEVIATETHLLDACAAAITVSPTLASLLRARAGNDKVRVITNGYDPELMASIEPRTFDEFAIVYAGTFYQPAIVINPVFAALRALDQKTLAWRFHYFGSYTHHVRRAAKQYGLQHRVVSHGFVPYREALAAIAGANLALVIATVREATTAHERGIITGKFFEPIGLRTPVLLIAPPGSDVDAVAQRTGLVTRFSGRDTEGIQRFIAGVMAGEATPPAREPERYSWNSAGDELDAILREAASR